MQETRNNCFGSKICSKTLRQAKTAKHESLNIAETYETHVLLCSEHDKHQSVCLVTLLTEDLVRSRKN